MRIRKTPSIPALLLPIVFASLAPAQQKPPAAPVRDVTDTYFGRSFIDPYRWMEDERDPELAAWLKAQNGHTRAALDALPGRKALLGRILELDRAGARVNAVQMFNGKFFYFKIDPDGDISKLYVRDVAGGPELLLVDPEKLGQGTGHSAIDFFQPSWDGARVAYGLSAGGSEQSVIHVLDVATATDLPDRIDRALYSYVSWLPDNASFFYFRLNKLAADAPAADRFKKVKTFLHRLGRDPDTDEAVFGHGVSPEVPLGERDWPIALYTPASPYLVGLSVHGAKNEMTVFAVRYRELAGSRTRWRKVADVDDAVTNVELHGEHAYLLTHKDAPRFKIVRARLARPDVAKAEVVVPEGNTVIASMGVSEDGLYYKEMEAGMSWISRLPFGGKPERVPMPFQGGAVLATFTHPTKPGVYFAHTGWTRSPAWLWYEPQKKQTSDTGLVAPSPVDFTGIEASEMLVKSHDGVMVPLSILHQRGIARDGRRPTLIVGYGAYGISIEPSFGPTRRAWLERGGVLAFAHVRGGGEYGEDWHKAGQKTTKRNTILDFIACAEYLVANGYTSPKYLGGTGTSAGGILIGGALVRRPDLFAAAIPRVGVTNALRFEVSQGGPGNVPEFGTVSIQEEFEALHEMDAYHHVRNETAYPAVLVTTGMNDPRVPVWQPAKFAARLQAATSSGKPVLLRVDYDAGHGLGSTRSQSAAQLADEWSFLLWQYGDPEFQPATTP
jgi:prolyl oligopeptidase